MKTKTKVLLIIIAILVVAVLSGTAFTAICQPVHHDGYNFVKFDSNSGHTVSYWRPAWIELSDNCHLAKS